MNVSFIVVNHNGKSHLETLFESLQALETAFTYEIIVVDNASQDGSVEWLKAMRPDIKVIVNETNEGFARPNNVAAKEASGEWLALINNDMRLTPNWLDEMMAIAQKHQCACVASRILNWDGKHLDYDGAAIAFSGHGLQPNYGKRVEKAEPCAVPFACGGAMLIRRDTFLEVGGFDESYFAYYEDVDLGWRLWVLGHEVFYAPAAIAYHRHNATSKSAPSFQKRVLLERNALTTALKNYDEAHLSLIIPALLLSAKRFVMHAGTDVTEFGFKLAAKPTPKKITFSKVLKTLKQQGLTAVLRKGIGALATRVAQRYTHIPFVEGGLAVDRDAFAIAVATSEVANHIEETMQRRAEIQEKRRRPDSEIFKLFGEPLFVLEGAGDYPSVHQAMVKAFALDKVF